MPFPRPPAQVPQPGREDQWPQLRIAGVLFVVTLENDLKTKMNMEKKHGFPTNMTGISELCMSRSIYWRESRGYVFKSVEIVVQSWRRVPRSWGSTYLLVGHPDGNECRNSKPLIPSPKSSPCSMLHFQISHLEPLIAKIHKNTIHEWPRINNQ